MANKRKRPAGAAAAVGTVVGTDKEPQQATIINVRPPGTTGQTPAATINPPATTTAVVPAQAKKRKRGGHKNKKKQKTTGEAAEGSSSSVVPGSSPTAHATTSSPSLPSFASAIRASPGAAAPPASKPSASPSASQQRKKKRDKKFQKMREGGAVPALPASHPTSPHVAPSQQASVKPTAAAATSSPSTTSSSTSGPVLSALQAKMKARLEGARFRDINEMLYTSRGDHALTTFKQEPELFEAVRFVCICAFDFLFSLFSLLLY